MQWTNVYIFQLSTNSYSIGIYGFSHLYRYPLVKYIFCLHDFVNQFRWITSSAILLHDFYLYTTWCSVSGNLLACSLGYIWCLFFNFIFILRKRNDEFTSVKLNHYLIIGLLYILFYRWTTQSLGNTKRDSDCWDNVVACSGCCASNVPLLEEMWALFWYTWQSNNNYKTGIPVHGFNELIKVYSTQNVPCSYIQIFNFATAQSILKHKCCFKRRQLQKISQRLLEIWFW